VRFSFGDLQLNLALQVRGQGRHSNRGISSVPLAALYVHPLYTSQVIVDHTTRVLAVSDIHPGSNTDEHISRLDEAVHQIRFSPLFKNFPFNLLSAPSSLSAHTGAYLISDGGYQAWRIFQMTFKFSSNPHLQRL
jgi:hypothetical protein